MPAKKKFYLIKFLKFSKILKAECSSTNKTCDNWWCKVKAVSRVDSFLNVNCTLKRKLNRFFVSLWCSFFTLFNFLLSQLNITVWHRVKTTMNYRQIVKFGRVELCGAMRNFNIFPAFKDFIAFGNNSYPGFMHACPYEVFKHLK